MTTDIEQRPHISAFIALALFCVAFFCTLRGCEQIRDEDSAAALGRRMAKQGYLLTDSPYAPGTGEAYHFTNAYLEAKLERFTIPYRNPGYHGEFDSGSVGEDQTPKPN